MGFRRELLPPPCTFYRQELRQLGKEHGGWAWALCPFHADKHPSLRVNLHQGHYRCFSCGAKGGDIIKFLMMRDGLTFKQAAQVLGAWDDGPMTRAARRQEARTRKLRKRLHSAAQKLDQLKHKWLIYFRDRIHSLEKDFREVAIAYLNRARQDATVDWELGWALHESVLDLLRRAIAAYYLLAFGSEVDGATFVLFPEKREPLVIEVINGGCVRSEDGKYVEVPLP